MLEIQGSETVNDFVKYSIFLHNGKGTIEQTIHSVIQICFLVNYCKSKLKLSAALFNIHISHYTYSTKWPMFFPLLHEEGPIFAEGLIQSDDSMKKESL